MTYDTCLKLKQAGFPQEIHYGGVYYLAPDETVRIAAGENSSVPNERFSDVVKIPTLTELIAECGDSFCILERNCGVDELRSLSWPWLACNHDDTIQERGDTAEEAVANLYLALRK